MVDSVRNDIITVTSQKQLSKRADEKAITDYVIKSFTTNTDESVINWMYHQKTTRSKLLENKPPCKGNSYFIVPKKNSEGRMNPKVLTSQALMPQIPELCDTPQIRKEEN